MKNPSKPKSFTILPMKNSVSVAGANSQSNKQHNLIFIQYFVFLYLFILNIYFYI